MLDQRRQGLLYCLGMAPTPTPTTDAASIRAKQGRAIIDARTAANLTQPELAEILNVTKQAVHQWEAGLVSPRPPMQMAIAKALNVKHSELFGLD